MDCDLCAHAVEHGWWGDTNVTHCRDCHRTWRRQTVEAHCAGCHRHFSSPSGFDAHFGRDDEHRDPVHKGAEYTQRDDGTWFKAGGAEIWNRRRMAGL